MAGIREAVRTPYGRSPRAVIEEIPLRANTVDVVISNCVINLSVAKRQVFAQMFQGAEARWEDRPC